MFGFTAYNQLVKLLNLHETVARMMLRGDDEASLARSEVGAVQAFLKPNHVSLMHEERRTWMTNVADAADARVAQVAHRVVQNRLHGWG